jgi:pantoate--beta-alanine ligase
MKQFSSIEDIRSYRWRRPLKTWGLVPTMGFLHEGHLSLVRRARQDNDNVGVSIFVNPTQFNNASDLGNYPSDIDRDLELLEKEGADLVWTPVPGIVYPDGYQTYIEVKDLTDRLEGGSRPGHFRGVTTIVSKLLNVFEPQRTYFGQKDAQQALVIKRMVKDLNFNLEVVVCPTVREPDGLAMSSRNANLTPENRKNAVCLHRALISAKDLFESGERRAGTIREKMKQLIEPVKGARVDYVSVAHPETLDELDRIEAEALISLAVFLGEVRLIDNIKIATKNITNEGLAE